MLYPLVLSWLFILLLSTINHAFLHPIFERVRFTANPRVRLHRAAILHDLLTLNNWDITMVYHGYKPYKVAYNPFTIETYLPRVAYGVVHERLATVFSFLRKDVDLQSKEISSTTIRYVYL